MNQQEFREIVEKAVSGDKDAPRSFCSNVSRSLTITAG